MKSIFLCKLMSSLLVFTLATVTVAEDLTAPSLTGTGEPYAVVGFRLDVSQTEITISIDTTFLPPVPSSVLVKAAIPDELREHFNVWHSMRKPAQNPNGAFYFYVFNEYKKIMSADPIDQSYLQKSLELWLIDVLEFDSIQLTRKAAPMTRTLVGFAKNLGKTEHRYQGGSFWASFVKWLAGKSSKKLVRNGAYYEAEGFSTPVSFATSSGRPITGKNIEEVVDGAIQQGGTLVVNAKEIPSQLAITKLQKLNWNGLKPGTAGGYITIQQGSMSVGAGHIHIATR